MLETAPRTLGEMASKDLVGYQKRECFYLELVHGLMGFFPARFKTNPDMPVVCLDKELLEKVREVLAKNRERQSKIGEITLLVNIEGKFGFDVKGGDGMKPLHILTEEEFEKRIAEEEELFEWTPGLLSFVD